MTVALAEHGVSTAAVRPWRWIRVQGSGTWHLERAAHPQDDMSIGITACGVAIPTLSIPLNVKGSLDLGDDGCLSCWGSV